MDEVEAGLFALNQHKLEICVSTSHMEDFRAAGAHYHQRNFPKTRQRRSQGGQLGRNAASAERRGTLHRGVKLSTGSVCLCGAGRAFLMRK